MSSNRPYRKPRRYTSGGEHAPNTKSVHIGYCQFIGKAQFRSKKDAKTTARRYSSKDEHPFLCDPGCGFWHLGTVAGISRAQHRQWHLEKFQ